MTHRFSNSKALRKSILDAITASALYSEKKIKTFGDLPHPVRILVLEHIQDAVDEVIKEIR